MILRLAILIQYRLVTCEVVSDRQTDRDRQTAAVYKRKISKTYIFYVEYN